MSDNDRKLYIPIGVKAEAEIFTGFGRKQLGQAIIGTLCFAAIAFFVYIISKNIAFTLVALLFGAVGSVMMTSKDQSNLSVVDQVGNMMRFVKSQKKYPIRYFSRFNETGISK